RWKTPSSALLKSRPTDGFSAMTSVLTIQNTIASDTRFARRWILARVRPSPFYMFVGVVSWPVLHGLYRLRSQGDENLPESGGFVLAANHTSNFDPWPLAMPLWPRRFLRFMAKSELYWWPLKLIVDAGGGFPVRRGERDVEAIRTAVQLAREGNVVAMFPHGTRQTKGLTKKH